MNKLAFLLALLMAAALVVGCPPKKHPDIFDGGGGDDDDDVADDDDMGDDDMAGCGPAELCDHTINECEVAMDMQDCLDWYDLGAAACADMNAYVACNCTCIFEATCEDYFTCGQTCFDNFCY